MADDVSGLLKHLKIDSADILGYSMGGGVAFQVVVRHPEQVRRLVVLSGTYTHDGWWPDVEASYSTFTADMFKGTIIEKQYDSLGDDPAHFPEYVKKVISIDLKPYDSVVFVSDPYVANASNFALLELYNVTDGQVIANSLLRTNRLYEEKIQLKTGNLFNGIPKKQITLGIRLSSETNGQFSASGSPYLLLYRSH
jgi:pimeloyl-ACP methyl ester carboxylesterase